VKPQVWTIRSSSTYSSNLLQTSFKSHRKSKSFSHFLPQLWVFKSNSNSTTDSGNVSASNNSDKIYHDRQVVEAIVERATTKDDYIDIPEDEAFSSPARDGKKCPSSDEDASKKECSSESQKDDIASVTVKDHNPCFQPE
jgi:hypothetical protein